MKLHGMHVTVGQEGKYSRPPEQTLFGSDVILDFHGCFSSSLRHFYTLAGSVFGHAVRPLYCLFSTVGPKRWKIGYLVKELTFLCHLYKKEPYVKFASFPFNNA